MDGYFKTEHLAVGYGKKILIHGINFSINRGEILTLIGPNGAGKSTILKSITAQIPTIHGKVYIGRDDIASWNVKEMAKKVSVLLTDRVRPELLTCAEVVAMGRYPYTNMYGKLTAEDSARVHESLELVHALDLANREFSTLSDGQRQRIMLARAICQEPELLVLDEPTAYLDIRYKIELMDILRDLSKTGVTIIMSLHEIDLAIKISDRLLCVKGDTIAAFGTVDDILKDDTVENLFDIESGSYNLLFGSVELKRPLGNPKVFVVAGAGYGIPVYRALQKGEIPFATGVLFENDVDYQVAKRLSMYAIASPPFDYIRGHKYDEAASLLTKCKAVVDAGTPVGVFNGSNTMLLELARAKGIPVHEMHR